MNSEPVSRRRTLLNELCWCAALFLSVSGASAELPQHQHHVPGSKSILKRWVQLLTAAADANLCPYQFPLHANGTAVGSWQLCCAALQQPSSTCLAVSVGIGDDWKFEDALAQYARCNVHAFDPTESLRAKHEAHVASSRHGSRNNLHFHYLGLDGRQAAGAFQQMVGVDRMPYGRGE